jgi:hypothetical protein
MGKFLCRHLPPRETRQVKLSSAKLIDRAVLSRAQGCFLGPLDHESMAHHEPKKPADRRSLPFQGLPWATLRSLILQSFSSCCREKGEHCFLSHHNRWPHYWRSWPQEMIRRHKKKPSPAFSGDGFSRAEKWYVPECK